VGHVYWSGKPHAQRRPRLIRAIAVGTVRVEHRYNMQPSAAVAQEVVATRTTAFDCAINARVGLRTSVHGSQGEPDGEVHYVLRPHATQTEECPRTEAAHHLAGHRVAA
jgi:hypothetical protein